MAGFTHLLDTSVYSQPIRKRPLASVTDRWKAHGDGRLCTSVICEAEVLQGLHLRSSAKLWKAYEEVLRGRLPLLDVDAQVAEVYARQAALLRRNGTPKPTFDLLIAATAQRHGLIVATCNYRDFTPLEGVAVEDWSKPG